MGTTVQLVNDGEEQSKTYKDKFDWGRVRAPWLGRADPTCLGQTDLEKMVYFGRVWETLDVANSCVSIATRSDDAEVDLTLWAVGGDGKELEQAQSVLRNFLLRIWNRKLCREACQWLHLQPVVDSKLQSANRAAVADCIARCANSTWWDWADGSHLLFWQWPPLWQSEARNGTQGYHFGTPPPRLCYLQVPIQEEWVVADTSR